MGDYKRLTDDYTEEEKRKHLAIVLCGMRKRCYKPKSNCYKNYGGRGITVCDEWMGKDGQKNFYKWATENGYKKGMTIDRINNNGNYTPDNCRWATPKTQAYNRSTNSYVTIHGKTQTVSEWADEIGISRGTMQNRLRYGWSEDRLLEPAHEPLKMSKGQMSAEIRRLRKFEKEINQKIERGRLVELPFAVFDKQAKKEADDYKIALEEDWAKFLCYCDMEGFAITQDGNIILLDECGKYVYCPCDRFEIITEARLKELQEKQK